MGSFALGVKDYVDVQLKSIEHLIFKAKLARSLESKRKYLLIVKSIIEKCLEALGVDKVEV